MASMTRDDDGYWDENCPFCKSANVRTVAQVGSINDESPNKYIYQCTDCKMIFTEDDV